MQGYFGTMLRTYFPAEFIMGYLNAAKNIDDIIKGDTLAAVLDISYLNEQQVRQKKAELISRLTGKPCSPFSFPIYKNRVVINNPCFGKSRGLYTLDSVNYELYKGVGSVKGINNTTADELYELGQQTKYKNAEKLSISEKHKLFYDLLKDILVNTSVKKNQVLSLIEIDYFRNFGHNKTLADIYELVSSLSGFKFSNISSRSIKKTDIAFLNIDLAKLKKYIGKETERTYSKVDLDGYISEIIGDISEDKAFGLKEQLALEKKHCGSYLTHEVAAYTVSDLRSYTNKNKPYLTLTHIQTGDIIKCSVDAPKQFILNSFENEDVLTDCVFEEKNKKERLPDGTYVSTDKKKILLKKWNVSK